MKVTQARNTVRRYVTQFLTTEKLLYQRLLTDCGAGQMANSVKPS